MKKRSLIILASALLASSLAFGRGSRGHHGGGHHGRHHGGHHGYYGYGYPYGYGYGLGFYWGGGSRRRLARDEDRMGRRYWTVKNRSDVGITVTNEDGKSVYLKPGEKKELDHPTRRFTVKSYDGQVKRDSTRNHYIEIYKRRGKLRISTSSDRY